MKHSRAVVLNHGCAKSCYQLGRWGGSFGLNLGEREQRKLDGGQRSEQFPHTRVLTSWTLHAAWASCVVAKITVCTSQQSTKTCAVRESRLGRLRKPSFLSPCCRLPIQNAARAWSTYYCHLLSFFRSPQDSSRKEKLRGHLSTSYGL